MALSDEQNAMLRLLAQGEQGYADIAALMGLGEDEVRAKVVGALAQLQAEGEPVPAVPPPIPGAPQPTAATGPRPAPAPSHAPAPPPAPAPTTGPTAPAPGAPPDSDPARGRTITLPAGRAAWLIGGGIVAAIVVVVVVVLLLLGGGDGGSSPPTEAAAGKAGEGRAATSAGGKPATEAKLKAVDGSRARGIASFGRVKNKLALQVEATGLAPTVEGTDSYAIWLARSPRQMIPLASTGVKARGKGAGVIAAQFEVPVEILGYLANGTFDKIAITKVDNKRFERGINVATRRKKTPTYLGEEVLRGTITGPIVGFAVREEEAKKAAEEGK